MTQAGPELVDALVQASFVTTAVLSRVGAEHDLSLTQLRVLGILRDRSLGVTALAEFLGLEKSTLSGLVERARRRGLVARVPHASDGRAVLVSLSPAGARLAVQVRAQVADALLPLVAGLTPAERTRLATLLMRVVVEPEG